MYNTQKIQTYGQTEPFAPYSSLEQYNFVCEESALDSCIVTKREVQDSLKEAKPEFSGGELSNLLSYYIAPSSFLWRENKSLSQSVSLPLSLPGYLDTLQVATPCLELTPGRCRAGAHS